MVNLMLEDLFSQQIRSTKEMISDSTIDSIRCIYLDEFDEEEAHLIQQLHKRLLKYAKNNNDSNEIGILVDIVDWSDILIVGDENSISMRTSYRAKNKMESSPKNCLIFLHNHPRNTCFSEVDLSTFMTSDSLYMISVVCNNGRQFFLIKTSMYDKGRALEYYENLFEKDDVSSVVEFLRTCRKVGLKFVYGGESL